MVDWWYDNWSSYWLFFENQKLELNQLEFLHIHKTAKLIAASLKMGAIISEYDLETQENYIVLELI